MAILLEAREELRAVGDLVHEADVLYYLGFGGLLDGNLDAALGAWQEAATLASRAGDPGREVRAQQRVIHALFDAGRRDEAEQLLRQAAERAPELSIVTRAQVWKSQGQYLTRYGIDVDEGRALLARARSRWGSSSATSTSGSAPWPAWPRSTSSPARRRTRCAGRRLTSTW